MKIIAISRFRELNEAGTVWLVIKSFEIYFSQFFPKEYFATFPFVLSNLDSFPLLFVALSVFLLKRKWLQSSAFVGLAFNVRFVIRYLLRHLNRALTLDRKWLSQVDFSWWIFLLLFMSSLTVLLLLSWLFTFLVLHFKWFLI